MAETLGERLKRLREEHGWNVYQAAKQAGMSPWALTVLERRTTLGGVQVQSLRKLALIYGVSIDYLVLNVEPEPALSAME